MKIEKILGESFLGMKLGLSIHEDPERSVISINYIRI